MSMIVAKTQTNLTQSYLGWDYTCSNVISMLRERSRSCQEKCEAKKSDMLG